MTKKSIFIIVLLLCSSAIASTKTSINFETIKLSKSLTQDENIRVYYFFNTNCPSCSLLSPEIEKWRQKNKIKIDFKSIPFSPIDNWEWATRAYITAKKINPLIKRTDIEIAQKKLGISIISDILRAADVVSIATGSERGNIMTELTSKSTREEELKIKELSLKMNVSGVPNIIIIGKETLYRVSPEFNLTTKGMINVTNALINYENTRGAN